MPDLSLSLDPNELQPIVPPGDVGTGTPSLGLPDAQTQPFEGLSAESANQNAALALSPRSLNLTPPSGTAVADRTQADRDYLQSLPTMEKIGLAMQSFKAGFDGTASPIDTLLAQRRQQRAESRAELASTMTMLTKGFEIVRKIPPGLQRNAVIAELSKQVGPVFAPLLAGAGTEHDNALRSFSEVVTDPDAQKIILNMCADDPNQQACWMTSMSKKEVADQIHTIVDGKKIYQGSQGQPSLLTKVQAYADSLKAKSAAAKASDPNADVSTQFTISDLAQSKLFSQSELETISRNKKNEETFAPFGLKTSAVQQAGDVAREQAVVKGENATEKYDVGKTAHIPGQPGTLIARVNKATGLLEVQGPDGQFANNPAARLISQPGVDKPPKPEADTAKIERDRILVKISRGGTADPAEQRFLDAYSKTDPFKTAIAGAISDAMGGNKTAPDGEVSPGGQNTGGPAGAGPVLTTNDTKIIAARRKVEGMTKEQAMKGDAATQRAWRTSGNALSTETRPPGVDKVTKPGAPDIAARFSADPAMTGAKLGATLADGRREVRKGGRLVGYYR